MCRVLHCLLEGHDDKTLAGDETFLRALYVVALECVLFVHESALRGLRFSLQLMQISAW